MVVRNAFFGIVFFAAVGGAQYYAPVYVAGGGTPLAPTTFYSGVTFIDARGATPVVRSLIKPSGLHRIKMDVDNRRLLVSSRIGSPAGPWARGGLFGMDPITAAYTTIYTNASATAGYNVEHAEIDQNGDVIIAAREFGFGPTVMGIYRVVQGRVTTIVPAASLGSGGDLRSAFCRDIDTGFMLVGDNQVNGPLAYPVYSIDTDTGAFTTWNTGGGVYGFWAFESLTQNHHTGTLQGIDGSALYEVRRGTQPRTTLATLSTTIYSAGRFDLQTAQVQRQHHYWATQLMTFDYGTRMLTGRTMTTLVVAPHAFEIYGSRNTQPVRTANRT